MQGARRRYVCLGPAGGPTRTLPRVPSLNPRKWRWSESDSGHRHTDRKMMRSMQQCTFVRPLDQRAFCFVCDFFHCLAHNTCVLYELSPPHVSGVPTKRLYAFARLYRRLSRIGVDSTPAHSRVGAAWAPDSHAVCICSAPPAGPSPGGATRTPPGERHRGAVRPPLYDPLISRDRWIVSFFFIMG